MRTIIIILYIIVMLTLFLPVMLVLLLVRLFNKNAAELFTQRLSHHVMGVVDRLAGVKLTVNVEE